MNACKPIHVNVQCLWQVLTVFVRPLETKSGQCNSICYIRFYAYILCIVMSLPAFKAFGLYIIHKVIVSQDF